ncbi:hypothetical protein DLAC_11842 [Tieghemostelium lacteum]|uniref:Actin binding protein n=1 Tax=Tieghemostelium lacteum TaxID=361077 RepID=A0A151Z3B1_TIELA|nr:hypothetical protein DLAC_11842 [Tieghemostelium lacteum]|eukprot:KYQ88407.1 hypothetical protein DLAC_11842 [Tieghemostelium lacteum]
MSDNLSNSTPTTSNGSASSLGVPTHSNNNINHGAPGSSMTKSISSENILSASTTQKPRTFTGILKSKSSGTNPGGANILSSSKSSTNISNITISSATGASLGNSLNGMQHHEDKPKLVHLHDFRPYKNSSSCVYCGETIRQLWPFTNSSYKCYYCGIKCHKKCLDLINTMPCSSATHYKKIHNSPSTQSPRLKSGSTPTLHSNNNNHNHNHSMLSNSSSSSSSGSSSNTPSSANSTPNTLSPTNSQIPLVVGAATSPPNSPQSLSSKGSPSLEDLIMTVNFNEKPDNQTINSIFESLAAELELPTTMALTVDKKWILLEQKLRLKKEEFLQNDTSSPQYFIKSLKSEPSKHLFQSLLVNIRTKSIHWFNNFIQNQGVELLFDILLIKKKEFRIECIIAIAKIMANPVGLSYVSNLTLAPKRLVMVLKSKQYELKARAVALELLTVLLMDKYSPGGSTLVLKALTKSKEKKRFSVLLRFIKENESLEMKTKALCFINVLIFEMEETTVRISIRAEFLRLGLYEYLQDLKKTLSPDEHLITQIEIFEEMMEEDNQEMEQKLDDLKRQLGIDIEDLDAVYKAIKTTAAKSGLSKSLLSILQNLLVIKTTDPDGTKYWLLCDSLIKQISLHKSGFGERDSFDFRGLLQNVDNAAAEVTLNRKLGELEKQNIDKAMKIQDQELTIKSLTELLKQIKNGGQNVDPSVVKKIEDILKSIDPPTLENVSATDIPVVIVPPNPVQEDQPKLQEVVNKMVEEIIPIEGGPPPPSSPTHDGRRTPTPSSPTLWQEGTSGY